MVTFDVVIVGAGIAGISTAYYLATTQQINNILLIDKRPPLTFTSDKSGSNYRNWWSHPAMMKLANHSIDLMDRLADKTGNIFNLNRRGYAYFNRERNILPRLKNYTGTDIGELRIHQSNSSSYNPAENVALTGADILIGSDLVRQHAPFVADDIQSMIHVRRAGWISTRVMAHYMLDQSSKMGLAEMYGELVTIETGGDNHRVVIDSDAGQQVITTPKLLLATGPYLNQFGTMLNTDFRLNNVYHKKLMLRDDGTILPDGMPFMIFRDSPVTQWSEPEKQYLLEHIGSGMFPGNFHIRRVNHQWIHLGWAFNQQASSTVDSHQNDPLFPGIVTKGMASFIPELKVMENNIPAPCIVSGGFYTRTAENLPIIQELETGGVFVIGGLSGFGVMMGCGIGDLMSQLIAGKSVPDYMKDFSVSRYANPAYLQSIEHYDSGEL